jgi:hypothetical protein
VRGIRRKKLCRAAVVSVVLSSCLLPIAGSSPAVAQSSTPIADFLDVYAPSYDPSPSGIVVEGLSGTNGCGYTLTQIEDRTVQYLNAGRPTITEISPQAHCTDSGGGVHYYTLSGYETLISNLVSYVVTYGSNVGSLWGGVMLDQEPDFGFSASDSAALASYTRSTMLNTPGICWYYTEIFAVGQTATWTQSQFDSIVGSPPPNGSWKAPQIYTDYMRNLTNAINQSEILVTWSTDAAPYPYNSRSYAVGSINGPPYQQNFQSSSTYTWANHFN